MVLVTGSQELNLLEMKGSDLELVGIRVEPKVAVMRLDIMNWKGWLWGGADSCWEATEGAPNGGGGCCVLLPSSPRGAALLQVGRENPPGPLAVSLSPASPGPTTPGPALPREEPAPPPFPWSSLLFS